MAKERLSMRKIKEALRLKYDGRLSNRQIAESLGAGRTTNELNPGTMHPPSAQAVAEKAIQYRGRHAAIMVFRQAFAWANCRSVEGRAKPVGAGACLAR